MVTFSYTRLPKVLLQLQRLVAQKIVTIVIDDELREPERLYCIPANERALGRVAGELIGMISPDKGTVPVSQGRADSKIHMNKIRSFTEYLKEKGSNLSVQVVKGYSNRPETDEIVSEALEEALKQYPDVVACYASRRCAFCWIRPDGNRGQRHDDHKKCETGGGRSALLVRHCHSVAAFLPGKEIFIVIQLRM